MEIVGDMEGVVCLVDDILVSSNTQEEHDRRLKAASSCLRDAGLTLGRENQTKQHPSNSTDETTY